MPIKDDFQEGADAAGVDSGGTRVSRWCKERETQVGSYGNVKSGGAPGLRPCPKRPGRRNRRRISRQRLSPRPKAAWAASCDKAPLPRQGYFLGIKGTCTA